MVFVTEPTKILEAMKAAVTALEPLEPDERDRAIRWIATTLGVSDAVPAAGGGGGSGGGGSGGGGSGGGGGPSTEHAGIDGKTPKAFMAEKKPTTDVERFACLGYYLTNARKQPQFKTRDISTLATEAAQPKMSNASQVGKDAVRANFLAGAGGGKRQMTDLGERVVEALPDQEAVKRVRAEVPKRRKRTRKSSKSSKS